MIDEYNEDRTGWARFSDDRTMRHRLARSLDGNPIVCRDGGVEWDHVGAPKRCAIRAVFLMLNPSTADAFVLDPTVKRCVAFARTMGADVLEVVNLFALRSTDPRELYKRAFGSRGDDLVASNEIIAACSGARWVIAGWGTHGALDYRGDVVRSMLLRSGVSLHHLGLNKDGSPKHPLYLKGGTEPQLWSPP